MSRKEQLCVQKEGLRENIVNSLIESSIAGSMTWDFSHFDDSVYGQQAVVKLGEITILCCDWQDTGVEVTIIEGEGENERRVDWFRGKKAMRLREFLKEQASKDPVLSKIRREEKARNRRLAKIERKKLGENISRLGRIAQSLKTTS